MRSMTREQSQQVLLWAPKQITDKVHLLHSTGQGYMELTGYVVVVLDDNPP